MTLNNLVNALSPSLHKHCQNSNKIWPYRLSISHLVHCHFDLVFNYGATKTAFLLPLSVPLIAYVDVTTNPIVKKLPEVIFTSLHNVLFVNKNYSLLILDTFLIFHILSPLFSTLASLNTSFSPFFVYNF